MSRIVLVVGKATGGIGIHVRDLAAGLAGLGHDVEVVTDPLTARTFGLDHARLLWPDPTRPDPRRLAQLRRLLRGADLVHAAFSLGNDCQPLLAINPLVTDTDKGEQRGFANLLVGLFGVIRNPLAHNPRAEWEMNEQDALDVLTTASLVHRKLDRAHKPGKPPKQPL